MAATESCWNGYKMELARGIEPPTSGLQNRCSAIELRQPGKIFTHFVRSRKRAGLTTFAGQSMLRP